MAEPSPYDGIPLIIMGGLVLVFRRAIARRASKLARSVFDRIWDEADENGAALFNAVSGGIAILFGLGLFLAWLTAR